MKVQEVFIPKIKTEKAAENLYLNSRRESIERKRNSELLLFFVIGLDVLFLNSSLIVFLGLEISFERIFGDLAQSMTTFLLVTNLLGIIVASFTNVFGLLEGVRLNLKIKDLFWNTLILFGVISLVYSQFFFEIFQSHFLLPAFLSFFTLSTITHVLFRYLNREMTNQLNYAVIGGTPSTLRNLEKVLVATFGKNTRCVGQFYSRNLPGIKHLGGFEDISSYIKNGTNIDKLLYLSSTMSVKKIQELGQLCRAHFIDFEVVPSEISFFEKGTQVEQLAHLPILRRKKEPLSKLQNRILKRAFDIVFSLSVIVFVFPWLLPLIAFLIRMESKGPIFFSQQRTGYSNKPFRCVKFRSMRINLESDEKQAVQNDNRITKVGAFLRKTSLDEFPQFLNVLWGDMSIVGPRPHMLKHTIDYSNMIERFMIRHEVKPGITGWAQVNGWRGPTEQLYKMSKRVEYDVFYIENWSFWFDLKCIFLTVFNMVEGEENAF